MMNKILTPQLFIEACQKELPERIESLKGYDTLDVWFTQKLIGNGFPKQYASYNDGEHNLITLQDMIDACDVCARYKGRLKDGTVVDAPIHLAYAQEDDGQFRCCFYGTWDGKDFRCHSRISPCLLEDVYEYILGFLKFSDCVTFETK